MKNTGVMEQHTELQACFHDHVNNNTEEQIKKKKMLSGIFHLIPLY